MYFHAEPTNNEVAEIALSLLPADQRPKFKLVYGAGRRATIRGVTLHQCWTPEPDQGEIALVEIAAAGEENLIQLAGTTIHELAHVISGPGFGHSATWKQNCKRIGLLNAKAKNMVYAPEHFRPEIWSDIESIQPPADGSPIWAVERAKGNDPGGSLCSAGNGAQGGTSRGKGSGSRLLKAICGDGCGYTFRVTQKWVDVGLPPQCVCGGEFQLDA